MKRFSMCLLCLAFFGCRSQSDSAVQVPELKNKIIGESASLSHFFEALDALKSDSCRTLSIVHIGDSHIQADYFSGMLRVLLQEKFGNAGRGLIFPYAVAHTNEPINYSSSGKGTWKGIRSVINPGGVAVGISGISLYSGQAAAGFSIRTRSQKGMSYAFNRVELISKTANPENTRLFSDQENVIAKKTGPFVSVFDLKDTVHRVEMTFSTKQGIDIHGLILKNGKGGILYHTIGANGATFDSYNSASLFMEQLPYLNPDLIIISLGTNESYSSKFDAAAFVSQLHTFMRGIQATSKPCSILLTTPSDNCKLKKGKVFPNNKPQMIGDSLKSFAQRNTYALWDLYEIMGGAGSMKQWKKQGLSAADHVHFTRKGYELQGHLLFEALINAYEKSH
jgi:lysophospholipase L1-like esterase